MVKSEPESPLWLFLLSLDHDADMTNLREALEASWKPDTAYLEVATQGNPALGQCYPTSRVVQLYFPKMEIVEGQVRTDKSTEKHFWNVLIINGEEYHVDLTWQQFPTGSSVKSYEIRKRQTLGDGENTLMRVELLHSRVKEYLTNKKHYQIVKAL